MKKKEDAKHPLLYWRRESNPQYGGLQSSHPRYHVATINQCFNGKNTLFLISQHCSINFFETAKHLQLTVDRLGKTSFIETSLFSSCVYPAYSVCIARGTQNAQDTPRRQPKSVANEEGKKTPRMVLEWSKKSPRRVR